MFKYLRIFLLTNLLDSFDPKIAPNLKAYISNPNSPINLKQKYLYLIKCSVFKLYYILMKDSIESKHCPFFLKYV